MVRTLKDPEERRAEIMDAAWELFNVKGFEETSVNDILEKVGIAKGTFYYYFKSKEEILDAVIRRGVLQQLEVFQPIIDDAGSNAIEKIKGIIVADRNLHRENVEFLEYLHKPENIVMHQKSLVLSIKTFAPVLATLIVQGNNERLFATEFPLETAEFIMTGMSFLLDTSIFPWSREEYMARVKALQDIMESALRAKKGTFDFFGEMAEDMFQNRYT